MDCHRLDFVCCCTYGHFANDDLFVSVSQACYPADIQIHWRHLQNRCRINNPMVFNFKFLIKMITDNLIYVANLGNGIFICDKSRRQFGYYVAVAHIDYHRNVKYYDELPFNTKVEIEELATSGNMPTSAANPYKYALRPLNSLKFLNSLNYVTQQPTTGINQPY